VSKAHAVRLGEDLSAWVESYAAERGVKASDLLRTAIEAFREDCEAGVPEIRALAREQAGMRSAAQAQVRGVGDCPKRPEGFGHVWGEGDERPCRFCRAPGRQKRVEGTPVGEPGHFERATASRAELFHRLRTPDSIKGVAKSAGRG
jgi:hypothetical protein